MMVKNVVGKVVAVLLSIALPVSVMFAEGRSAMLFASNSAFLNGASFQRTSTVFPGDKVSVPADSALTITTSGSLVLVPALSSVTYNGDSVSLDPQAAVAITTSKGMAAQIGNIRIAPARDGSASYQVGRFNGQVVIAAKQGTVLIAGLTPSRELAAGSTTTIPDPGEPQKKKGGAVPPISGAGASAAASSIPTWVAVLIAAAAVVAAGAAAIATTGAPATPPHP